MKIIYWVLSMLTNWLYGIIMDLINRHTTESIVPWILFNN